MTTFSLTWLATVLDNAGLKVAETPGWRSRGRADMPRPLGVMCHHTANPHSGNMPTLNMLINGRSDLPGPLCQLGLGRDGTFYVVAAGRANHAGLGRWQSDEHPRWVPLVRFPTAPSGRSGHPEGVGAGIDPRWRGRQNSRS